MIANIKKHFWYYAVLLIMQGVGLGLLFLTAGNRPLQLASLFFMAFFYFIWPVSHHYIHHNLTPKIVSEYLFIGVLGVIILSFLLP